MPDLDYLPRRVGRGWSKAANAVRGRHEPAVVGAVIEKAIAKTLRRCGGVPWLPAMGVALGEAWQERSSRKIEALAERLDPDEMTGGRGAFVDAARSLAASGLAFEPGRLIADADPRRALAAEGLRRLAWRLCLGGLEPALVGETFADSGEYRGYVDDCLRTVRFEVLAERLLSSDPRRITAPRCTRRRQSTAELLHVPVA